MIVLYWIVASGKLFNLLQSNWKNQTFYLLIQLEELNILFIDISVFFYKMWHNYLSNDMGEKVISAQTLRWWSTSRVDHKPDREEGCLQPREDYMTWPWSLPLPRNLELLLQHCHHFQVGETVIFLLCDMYFFPCRLFHSISSSTFLIWALRFWLIKLR